MQPYAAEKDVKKVQKRDRLEIMENKIKKRYEKNMKKRWGKIDEEKKKKQKKTQKNDAEKQDVKKGQIEND